MTKNTPSLLRLMLLGEALLGLPWPASEEFARLYLEQGELTEEQQQELEARALKHLKAQWRRCSE